MACSGSPLTEKLQASSQLLRAMHARALRTRTAGLLGASEARELNVPPQGNKAERSVWPLNSTWSVTCIWLCATFFGFMKIWGHFVSLGEFHNYYLPEVKLSLKIGQ